MTDDVSREYSYREFSSFLRRFQQETLLTAAAQGSLKVPLRLSGEGRDVQTFIAMPPWALAAVAKSGIRL